MLRITEAKKCQQSLGYPAGKEIRVKQQLQSGGSTDFSTAPVYVKFGRELSKHAANLQESMAWNVTLFDTALNHPRQPWMVSSGKEAMVLAVKNQGLGVYEENSREDKKVNGVDELTIEDYDCRNCTIDLVVDGGKNFVIAVDDTHMVNSFEVKNSAGKFSLQPPGIAVEGEALPVTKQDGSTLLVLVNNGGQSALHTLDGKGKKTPLKVTADAIKILMTNSNEILHISAQGMNVYAVSDSATSFKYYCPFFSGMGGWSRLFIDSVQLMKIENGQEALIGTGPKGIEYFKLSSECKSYIVEGSAKAELKKTKYAMVTSAATKANNQFKVLGYYNTDLYVITLQLQESTTSVLEWKEPDNQKLPGEKVKAIASSKFAIQAADKSRKVIRWWRDGIDEACFKNIVDKVMAKVKFSFPLIDMRDRMGLPIKLMVYYEESESEEIGVLGRHWTLGKDCIVMDHHNTVFEEEHEYYLIKDQIKIRLMRDWSKQSGGGGGGGSLWFNVKGISGVNFEYNRIEEKWVVDNGKVRYTYGGKSQGAVTVAGWNNWNGPSEKLNGRQQLSVEWNLVEIRSTLNEDVKITYQYSTTDSNTNSMHLKSISDNGSTKITFSYKDMDTKTKIDSSTVKQHQFTNNKLLQRIDVDTYSYTQNLEISTTTINNVHYLESIKQKGDKDPVLQFQYNKADELLPKIEQIDLPSKSILKIKYSNQAIDTNQFHQEEDKFSDLYTGMEYSLLIRKNPDETTLTISTKDTSGRNDFVSEEKMNIDAVQGHKLKGFVPFIQSNYFALVVDYSKGEETVSKVYIFNRGDDKKFKQDRSRERTADSKLPRYDFQDDFFAYYGSGKINFEHRTNLTSPWTPVSQNIGSVVLLTMITRGAVYFTDELNLIRCDQSGTLVQKTLSDPANVPKLSDIDSLFMHIDVQGTNPDDEAQAAEEVKDYTEDVKNTFNNHGLVVYNNLVALRTVLLQPDGKVSIKLFLYLLNSSYDASQKSTIDLVGEDINEFVLKLDVYDEHKAKSLDDLDKYRFEFRKSGSKYQLKFIEATDKSGQNTDPSPQYKDNIEAYERQLKIPLDFEKYMMQVNHDGIVVANQQIIHSEGKFIAKPMDRESLKLTKFLFPMGSFSSLKKDSESAEIKFCTQTEQQREENCVGLEVDVAHNVSVKYPYFFVVQKRTDTKVLPLKINGRGWEEPKEYQGETARASTSHAVMVTTRVADNRTMIRPTKSLNKDGKAFVQVVQLEELSTPYEDYKIKYEYEEPSVAGNEFAFKTIKVFPGGSKETFGYFREINDLKSDQQVVQVITADDQVFDPEYVKRMNEMQEEEQRQREPEKLNKEQAVMDKTGNHVVLKTIPYMQQQNLVHFIGFEDYEDTREWLVNGRPVNSGIRRNEFSATGRNFFLLKRGEVLERRLNDIPYFDYFIVSAWVRTTREVTVGSKTDIIGMWVNSNYLGGEIKQSIDDWMYVEATSKSIEVTNGGKVTLTIVLAAMHNDIHVDHVRISPMNFNLEANVYDSAVGQQTAQIHNNGRISRRLFDTLSRRVGEVDENGNVKFLTSYSKRIGFEKASRNAKLEGSNLARIQIKPKLGWAEDFSPYTMDSCWSFAGTPGSLTVEPRTLTLQGTMTFKHQFSGDSICLRFVYNIKNNYTISISIDKTTVNVKQNEVSYKRTVQSPSSAEIIIFTTPTFTTIWIDGHIVIEEAEAKAVFTKETLAIQTTGPIEISDLVIMEDAEVQISYMNRDYKPLQEILLQNSANVLIRQMTYDGLGRKEGETVWTQKAITAAQPFKVLQYQEDFVQNDDPTKQDYFLKQGQMTGVVSSANPMFNSFPYSQIVYHRNPLEIRHKIGQPGQEYSVKGKYVHEYNIESELPFIKTYYPKKDGYRQEQENKPNGIVQVTVYNRRNRKVAEYIQVKDHNNLLTTYAYDQHGNQIQMVPPKYYDEQKKRQPSPAGFIPEKALTDSPWVVSSEYDETGELITKKSTPDGGRVDFLYNEFKQLRYQLHYGENNQVDLIVYFLYNVFGRVSEAGQLTASADMVRKVNETTETHQAIPSRDYAMYFDNGEAEEDPVMRGRVQRIVKKNKDLSLSEVLQFDEDGNVIRKSFTSPVTNATLSLEYLKENEQVGGIRYPFVVDGEELVLKIRHNLRGDIVEVSRMRKTGDKQIEFLPIVSMDHDAEGRLTKISHLYGEKQFEQRYKYIAPGYLESIENEFLSEKLYYTENGYGCGATGDGSIIRTEFKATWHDKCDQNLIPLTARAFVSDKIDFKVAEACFDALFSLGYIDTRGRPTKTFYPDLEVNIPARCSTTSDWRHFSEMLLAKGFPEEFGHAYDYGSHGELVAAKSFIGEEKDKLSGPLSKESFSSAGFRSQSDIDKFWNAFKNLDYKLGGTKLLFEDDSSQYGDLIRQVIHKLKLEAILTGNESKIDSSTCLAMVSGEADESKAKSDCESKIKTIWNQIQFKEPIRSLDPAVKTKVLRILKASLATALGSSPGDVESFSIDPNGNHGVFYTGFNRFELQYKKNKNQIETIKQGLNHQPRAIAHDSQGNIIKALHKNIEKIEYDPLTQRVSRIELTNMSRILEFGYDFRGERTIKRVRNANNEIVSETYYVGDIKGNTLVEFKQVYPNPKESNKAINTLTAYIHGPLGLIGFFRNNKYYNVLLDHEGSTRLVVHNGEVVAAYDYLPYGQLIRTYGSNPEAHISYRYTGQEFDEETGLYNYHARIYDPDIGRFYQMDPLEQYPSPYKYAGNSPVTQVDPDGQFAVLLFFIIAAAIAGAYVGASAANNSWDPAKWDWKDYKTWLGMFAGAVAGAFAVYGGVGAVGVFAGLFGGSMVAGVAVTGAIAVAGAYLGAAAATNQWNPAKWDWTSPAIWNGIFNGISVAVSLPTGVVGIARSFMSISSTVAKVVYTIALASGFLLFAYIGGSLATNDWTMQTWDWKSPQTWFGVIEGAATILIAVGAIAKQGVAKTHYIVTPDKLKATWYRIAIPKKSFTLVRVKDTIVLSWYKHGQLIGKEFLKTTNRAAVARIITQTVQMKKAFFMPLERIAYYAIAAPIFAFIKFETYKTFFNNYPNSTDEKSTRRKRSADSVHSSASSSASGMLHDFVKFFSSFFAHQASPDGNFTTQDASIFSPPAATNVTEKRFEKMCYSPNDQANQITCPQRDSTINVFSKLPEFAADCFGQDSFRSCQPVNWFDRPSVACDGEQSTFIYTPGQNARLFDMVDGWILLARVAPAAVRNLKAGFGYVKNVFVGSSNRKARQIRNVSNVKHDLQQQLSEVDKILRSKTAADVDWARPILADLRDDIGEFARKANPSRNELVLLQERLHSLTEDLVVDDECFTEKFDICGTFLEKAKEMFTGGSLDQYGNLLFSQTNDLSAVFSDNVDQFLK